MQVAPFPEDEQSRRDALASLGILDTPAEERLDRLVRQVAERLRTPIAYISFVADDRQWLKANQGMPTCETSREVAFCAHAILEDEYLVIPDTHRDARFADNPMVTGEPFLRAYLGVPLRTPGGFAVGTLCVADTEPREFTPEEVEFVRDRARLIERGFNTAQLKTLVVTDLVGSTKLVESLGDTRAAEIFGRQDRLARDCLNRFGGTEIDKTDGFLLLFDRPLDAVDFSLAYHDGLDELGKTLDCDLQTRSGIHVAEIILKKNPPEDVARGAKPIEVEGLAKSFTGRLMSLAAGRQTLLSRAAFDIARRRGPELMHPQRTALRWMAHGDYLMKGVGDAVEVYEVGVDGFAPLRPPADTAKVRRAGDSSEVLGWRAAPGQEIPGRPEFTLEDRLGEGGFGEVWLASHVRSGDRRVFKFCYDGERLAALQREVTLLRLLKEELGDRRNIARIHDWRLDETPYYLESAYTEGGSLRDWARERGGIAAVPLATRLEIVAQAADAVAAAHSVGVLHKDIKPGNLLIRTDQSGVPAVVLTDFGIGQLVDDARLAASDITVLGLDAVDATGELSTGGGTPRYVAPEVLQGDPPSIQADVYALGVLLYQMVCGDLAKVLAPGWERDVEDELLREEIARAVDGNPQRRLANALRLAENLRDLEERRRARAAARQAALKRDRLQRSWRLAWIGLTAMTLAAVGAAIGLVRARAAERQALESEQTAERVSDFLADLFQVSNPSESRGNAVTAREVLDRGAASIGEELADEPELRGRLLMTMAHAYQGLGLLDVAGDLAREAVEVRRATYGSEHRLVAASLEAVGRIAMFQGDLDGAATSMQEALAIRESILEPDSGALADSYSSVGALMYERGDLDEARRLMERSLDVYDARSELSNSAGALNNLAFIAQAQGDFDAAVGYSRHAADIRIELLGDDHPDVADSLDAIAGALGGQGDWAAAAEIRREVVGRRQRAVGEDHYETGLAWANLGVSLTETGELDAAEEAHRRALTILESSVPGSQFHAEGLNGLAAVLQRAGKLEAAEPYYREQLSVLAGIHGDQPSPSEGRALGNLASLLTAAGHPAEAEQLARRAVAMIADTLGATHWSVAYYQSVLGLALQASGKLPEAEAMFRTSVALATSALGSEHPRVTGFQRYLGSLLVEQERCDEAGEVFDNAARAARGRADDAMLAAIEEERAGCRVVGAPDRD